MLKLAQLKNRYKGRPAAVLGGGPSLRADYARVLGAGLDPLLIAVNHHASCVGLEPDIMVFMDAPLNFPLLFQVAKDFDGLRVSPLLQYSDVDMRGVVYWDGPCSDKPATWLACFMGCDPVLLCGMDLYQGEIKYCHAGELEKPIFELPLETHLARWRKGFKLCPGIQRVRAVSGPLVGLFGAWEPAHSTQDPA